jgi:hypothetical protein
MRKVFGGNWQGNVEIEINNNVEYVGSFVSGGYRRSEPISFGVKGNDQVRVIANGLNGFDEYYTVQNGLGDTIIDFNNGNSPTITVQPCFSPGTGTLEINNNKIDIYPNPSNNILKIKSEIKISNVTITNIFGQTVYLNNRTEKYFEIDVSNFSNGFYQVTLTDNKFNIETRKLVIRH